MCRYVIFENAREVPFFRAYLQFAASMGVVRGADWCFYTSLVELLQIPYLAAQLVTMGVFITIKFVFAKAIFDKKG